MTHFTIGQQVMPTEQQTIILGAVHEFIAPSDMRPADPRPPLGHLGIWRDTFNREIKHHLGHLPDSTDVEWALHRAGWFEEETDWWVRAWSECPHGEQCRPCVPPKPNLEEQP